MIVATNSTSTGFAGTYLTDGHDLYRIGERIGDADLWQVEDCRTLHVLVLSGPELHDGSLRRVRTTGFAEVLSPAGGGALSQSVTSPDGGGVTRP